MRRRPRDGWILCSQPIAWDASGAPSRTCSRRAKWLFSDDPGVWRWYCTLHDPDRPRCSNTTAHPIDLAKLPGPAFASIGQVFGRPPDPLTPKGVGRFRDVLDTWELDDDEIGRPLCRACAEALAVEAVDQVARVPCCLCKGTRVLVTERRRKFPCVCTKEGRALANATRPL